MKRAPRSPYHLFHIVLIGFGLFGIVLGIICAPKSQSLSHGDTIGTSHSAPHLRISGTFRKLSRKLLSSQIYEVPVVGPSQSENFGSIALWGAVILASFALVFVSAWRYHGKCHDSVEKHVQALHFLYAREHLPVAHPVPENVFCEVVFTPATVVNGQKWRKLYKMFESGTMKLVEQRWTEQRSSLGRWSFST